MAYATLGASAGSPASQVTVSGPRRTRRPSRRSRAKADRPRSETTATVRPTAEPAPCGGAPPGRPGLPGSTSGAGSRGVSPVCGCSADRDVSRMASPRGRRVGPRRRAPTRAGRTLASLRRSRRPAHRRPSSHQSALEPPPGDGATVLPAPGRKRQPGGVPPLPWPSCASARAPAAQTISHTISTGWGYRGSTVGGVSGGRGRASVGRLRGKAARRVA